MKSPSGVVLTDSGREFSIEDTSDRVALNWWKSSKAPRSSSWDRVWRADRIRRSASPFRHEQPLAVRRHSVPVLPITAAISPQS